MKCLDRYVPQGRFMVELFNGISVCSGFGGNAGLCTDSGDGSTFRFPYSYTLPCSTAGVVSVSVAPSPGESPSLSPGLAPEESSQAPGPVRRLPAVTVPVGAPEAIIATNLSECILPLQAYPSKSTLLGTDEWHPSNIISFTKASFQESPDLVLFIELQTHV